MAYYTQFVVALSCAQEREEKNSKMSDGSQSRVSSNLKAKKS